MSKAVDMCFRANLFDVLQHITDDPSVSPLYTPACFWLGPWTKCIMDLRWRGCGLLCACVHLHSPARL